MCNASDLEFAMNVLLLDGIFSWFMRKDDDNYHGNSYFASKSYKNRPFSVIKPMSAIQAHDAGHNPTFFIL